MNYKELKEKIKQILEMEYFGDITQEQAVEAILKEVIPMVEKKVWKDAYRQVKNISNSSCAPRADVIKHLWRKAYQWKYDKESE